MTTRKPEYDWTQFTLRIFIAAKLEKVFAAWTNDWLVSKWFTEKTVIEPKKGGRLYFEWLAGDKLETKIVDIVKNRKLVFPFGPGKVEVAVTFKKDGTGTVCELHQYGMKTDPKSKWNLHRGCIQGWTFFLTNLKAYLEHGLDLRSHDIKRSYRQDYVNS